MTSATDFDEYDSYNLSQFSAEELALADPTTGSAELSSPSPYKLYRARRKVLSVSDLIGPLWCEVQFDYGLRQRRWQPLEERPRSFLGANGQAIHVNHALAAENDHILKAGTVIHERLERELRPETIQVQPESELETWALRLIRIISCFADLDTHGLCREMPTFGFMHGQLVSGTIDEVRKQAIPGSYRNRFHLLHITDTKSRTNSSLPSDKDAHPARMQLMIYHRLLTDIMSPSFSWPELWSRVGLDPYAPLRHEFLQQSLHLLPGTYSERLITGQGRDLQCTLDATVQALQTTVKAVKVTSVAPMVKVVYCRQHALAPKSGPQYNAEQLQTIQAEIEIELMKEDGALPELARMIAVDAIKTRYPRAVTNTASDKPHDKNVNPRAFASSPVLQETSVSLSSQTAPDKGPDIIGVKEFYMDQELLDDHLDWILAYWMGVRAPEGVPVENTWRCNRCEYKDGCEWRAAKAREIESQFGIP
ncbi:hypothetical protein PENSPDRAFT_688068 [Peniophora sp. CONT]|nr:hypothetical protein PENSPDRAFT_688068 [Peniophora sp. CONT]